MRCVLWMLLGACGAPTVQVEPTPEAPVVELDPVAQAVDRIRAATPPCLGKFARVDVWRTPEGGVHRLFYHGDRSCSHPPSVWYDATGDELEQVPMEPVTDDNRAHYDAIWARHTTGATKSETLFVLGAPTLGD
jgi:hypothetical protein